MLFVAKEKLIEDELDKHIITHRVGADNAYLVVLSDIHQGANHRELLKETIDFLLSIPNCYIIIGSDSTNSITKNSKGTIRDEWAHGDEQIFALADDLKPLKDAGRLLGIMGAGNHNARIMDDCYISTEMILAGVLGDRTLYKGEYGLVYFNVNKNCYVCGIVHKGSKRADYFDFMRYDVMFHEHYHLYKVEPKLAIDHNKFTKKPIVRTTYDIWNGSYQVFPDYAKFSGYRPQLFGTHIVEFSGGYLDHKVKVWQDRELYEAFNRGYK